MPFNSVNPKSRLRSLAAVMRISVLLCALAALAAAQVSGGHWRTPKPNNGRHPRFISNTWASSKECIVRFNSTERRDAYLSQFEEGDVWQIRGTYITPCLPKSINREDKAGYSAYVQALLEDTDVLLFEPVSERAPQAMSLPTDPSFDQQWYLYAEGSEAYDNGLAYDYVDINILPAWDSGIKGSGQHVVVVDTGMQSDHPDLAANYYKPYSYNYHQNAAYSTPADPTPSSDSMDHGTATTSLIAAAMDNGECMAGVAPEAQWSGRFMVDATIYGSMSAALDHALTADEEAFCVSSNSWGYYMCDAFSNCEYQGAYSVLDGALDEGIANGNDGRGVSYIFASGNEGNLLGHTNLAPPCRNFGVTCIGAITSDGRRADYTTYGSALFVTAPSGGSTDFGESVPIQTARNPDECSTYSGGTSFSCPIVSGVVVLLNDANGSLTWKDIKHILQITSKPVDTCETGSTCHFGDWNTNGAGVQFSKHYGFGLVDASAAVTLAQSWPKTVPDSVTVSKEDARLKSNTLEPAVIPGRGGVGWKFDLAFADTFMEVEAVQLTVEYRGEQQRGEGDIPTGEDLVLSIVSPAGTRSNVSEVTRSWAIYDGSPDYSHKDAFPSLTNEFWGEAADGTWTVEVVCEEHCPKVASQELMQAELTLIGFERFASFAGASGAAGGPVPVFASGTTTVRWVYNTGMSGVTSATAVTLAAVQGGTVSTVGASTLGTEELTGDFTGYSTAEPLYLCLYAGNDPNVCLRNYVSTEYTLQLAEFVEASAIIYEPRKDSEVDVSVPVVVSWYSMTTTSAGISIAVTDATGAQESLTPSSSGSNTVTVSLNANTVGDVTLSVVDLSSATLGSVTVRAFDSTATVGNVKAVNTYQYDFLPVSWDSAAAGSGSVTIGIVDANGAYEEVATVSDDPGFYAWLAMDAYDDPVQVRVTKSGVSALSDEIQIVTSDLVSFSLSATEVTDEDTLTIGFSSRDAVPFYGTLFISPSTDSLSDAYYYTDSFGYMLRWPNSAETTLSMSGINADTYYVCFTDSSSQTIYGCSSAFEVTGSLSTLVIVLICIGAVVVAIIAFLVLFRIYRK
eukprot:gnl/Chilomastix_cuspidata/799.p1 GENE.gnl/Chilomastix_cuspidata/799~~gnl/Chilomastix_cuspidata/799.p1  ORF type:complete len:1077 (+),score=284.48 gnl/Chilomastix_cuspidata/799:1714-4944(+)